MYIKNRIWLENPNLIIPPNTPESIAGSAHKKCECCSKVKFTADFPNYDEFPDEKLPVCTKCFKMKDDRGRTVIRLTGITRTCTRCGALQTLDRYSYTKRGNTLRTACKQCGRKAFKDRRK